MQVLFLSHRYSDVTVGGLAEFLHYLPTALKDCGVESIIYTRSKQADKQSHGPEMLNNNVPHYSGPFLKPSLFISKKELQPLINLCQQKKIDLIHAQGTYRAGYMAMYVNKQLGIPYVVTSHSDISGVNSERLSRFNIKYRCKRVLKNATYVTHLSPHMAKASHQIYDTENKSKIIHNGIHIQDWLNFLNQPEQDYMLAIGRLVPEKGFPLLVDAYARLLKEGTKTSLVIAGTGAIEHDLQANAKQLGINVVLDKVDFNHLPPQSIIFTGYIRDAEKLKLYAQAKCVLFATQPQIFEEAFGIVLIETMAAGKALIASDIDAVRYLQSFGLQASLVKPESVNDWVKAMRSLLADQGMRLEMGKRNSDAIKKFDWPIIAKEYSEVYRLALKS